MAPEKLGTLGIIHRCPRARRPAQLLEPLPRPGRRVHEKDPGGFGAGILPGMCEAAWDEGAGTGPADGDPVADLRRDLSTEDIDHLVAVVVPMVWPGRGA